MKPEIARVIAARSQSMADLMSLIEAGQLEMAEEFIHATTPGEVGTAQWHHRAGDGFYRLLANVQRQGRAEATNFLAIRAVQHFARADQLSDNPSVKAAVCRKAATACERYLGDPETAKAWYRASAQANPADGRSAEALSRLEASEHAAQARITAGSR